jgi:hypothetical protein
MKVRKYKHQQFLFDKSKVYFIRVPTVKHEDDSLLGYGADSSIIREINHRPDDGGSTHL